MGTPGFRAPPSVCEAGGARPSAGAGRSDPAAGLQSRPGHLLAEGREWLRRLSLTPLTWVLGVSASPIQSWHKSDMNNAREKRGEPGHVA